MKTLKIWVILTLLVISKTAFGAEYPDFNVNRISGTSPKIGEPNILLAKYSIYVKYDWSAIYSFSATCTLNGKKIKNFTCLLDNSSSNINVHDSLVGFTQTMQLYAGSTHTIEFYCDAEYKDLTSCAFGQIDFCIKDLTLVGPNHIDSISEQILIPISVGEINHNTSSFTPSTVKKIDSTFVKVDEIIFFSENQTIVNDLLKIGFGSDFKKVRRAKIVINGVPEYKDAEKSMTILLSDTLKVGSFYAIDIYFQLDSQYFKLKDSVTASIYIAGHDKCYPTDDIVAVQTMIIDQKTTSSGGTGINQYSSTEKILVYPNPAHNELNIVGLSEGQTISITDLSGKNILTTVSNGRIDISSLTPGMYIVQTGSQTSKFIKEY